MNKIILRGSPVVRMKPLVLTGIFSETNGLPKLFTDELDKHFTVLPENKYHENPEEFNKGNIG